MEQKANDNKLPKGIRQRFDGRYEGRFKYKGEYYTFYNMDLRLLKKEMQEKRYEVEHGLYAKTTNLSVDSWFHTWMEEYKKTEVKYGTYKLYGDEYDIHIKRPFGRRKLADIRSEHIQKLINDIAKNYSKSTVYIVKVILGGMFKQAYRNKMIISNPVENITLPKKKKRKEIQVMTEAEQGIFLSYAKKSFYYSLYMVALGTGMRNGEIRALQWQDIDFDKRIIHVNSTLKYIPKGEPKYMFDTPKSQSSIREIPMLDNVYTILKEHRKQQLQNKQLLEERWSPQKGFENLVFTGCFGRCVTEQAVYQDMKAIQQRITDDGKQICKLNPHILRHTFATRGLERGIPPKVMQELLGHSSISMTLDIYSHVLPSTKAKEIRKISDCF